MPPPPKFPTLTVYDLKSKDAKYKRWLPKMDHYLVRLLATAVNHHQLDKKVWAQVTSGLRAVNPQTVYSTYTKYSCQQHLYHVIHHRYKIWYSLVVHQAHAPPAPWTYRWNSVAGRMELLELTGVKIEDDMRVKDLLYRQVLLLPPLAHYSKAMVIVNEMFLTDKLRYLSVYHNVVLPYMIGIDPRYADVGIDACSGTTDRIFAGVPKFAFPDHEYSQVEFFELPVLEDKPEVPLGPHEFESTLATAAMAAIDSPAVVGENTNYPVYVRDKQWFNRLVALEEKKYITVDDVLAVSVGVRDGRVPLFMLNILDASYDGTNAKDDPDEVVANRVRSYMLPMVYQ